MLVGIVYAVRGGEGRGGQAVLVDADDPHEEAYRRTLYKPRWRPSMRWAARTARRWAARENQRRNREQARRTLASNLTTRAFDLADRDATKPEENR